MMWMKDVLYFNVSYVLFCVYIFLQYYEKVGSAYELKIEKMHAKDRITTSSTLVSTSDASSDLVQVFY
jgi:hypothetical protein